MTNITNSNFVHTHVHSSYSAFDGLTSVHDLVHKVRKMGFKSLALTDHGSIGGWVKFLQECSAQQDKNGKDIPYPQIKPLLGVEAYLCNNRFVKSKREQPSGRRGNTHLILLAKNWKGYENICKLVNTSWVEGFYMDPRIDMDVLSQCSEGVIVSTACLKGIININLLHGRYAEAKRIATCFKDIFKDDFFFEVMYHGINAQRIIMPDIFRLAMELNIPICASNDCHYLEKEHAASHEVLMAMATGRCLSDPKRMRFPYGEFYLKDINEMVKIFGSHPRVLTNTVMLAERVDTEDIRKNLYSGMRLPRFEVPFGFASPLEYLRHLATQGLVKLGWDKSPEHIAAFEKELEDIKVAYDNNKYDFATYFLIVHDYINHAKKKGILIGPGRGSGYASVILRCLGVTYGINPLQAGLWERFLGFKNAKFVKADDFYSE